MTNNSFSGRERTNTVLSVDRKKIEREIVWLCKKKSHDEADQETDQRIRECSQWNGYARGHFGPPLSWGWSKVIWGWRFVLKCASERQRYRGRFSSLPWRGGPCLFLHGEFTDGVPLEHLGSLTPGEYSPWITFSSEDFHHFHLNQHRCPPWLKILHYIYSFTQTDQCKFQIIHIIILWKYGVQIMYLSNTVIETI